MTTVRTDRTKTAKSGKTTFTDYQVLVREAGPVGSTWRELTLVAAHTPDQAIKLAVEQEGYEQEQVLVAVPVSRWVPRAIKVETTTKIQLSTPVPEEAPDDEWSTPLPDDNDGA